MNNPGMLPLNSGVDIGTSSFPSSSPTKGPSGSTPAKNMPSFTPDFPATPAAPTFSWNNNGGFTNPGANSGNNN